MTSNSSSPRSQRIWLILAWVFACGLVLTTAYLGWNIYQQRAAEPAAEVAATPAPLLAAPEEPETASLYLPPYKIDSRMLSVSRQTDLHTNIPNRPRQDVLKYTVTTGDSVFGIAQKYNIKPETLLWSNYDQLQDSPDQLSPGMELNIPPVDGIYYQWQEGDTIDGVAAEFEATSDDILNWSGNHIDLTAPEIEPGQWVLIPNGQREFQQWLVPTIGRDGAGVNKNVLGPGACGGSYSGLYGSGAFVYPTSNHYLSGNDYWSGHLGIDLAGGLGDGIFASDAGVVVFAGWAYNGYGNMIMIDHGNGYQTLYAHLSAYSVACGQSVTAGKYIGAMGSTGNSTGPHLHFEVRYLGGFIDPWYVLPAP